MGYWEVCEMACDSYPVPTFGTIYGINAHILCVCVCVCPTKNSGTGYCGAILLSPIWRALPDKLCKLLHHLIQCVVLEKEAFGTFYSVCHEITPFKFQQCNTQEIGHLPKEGCQ